MNFLKCVDLKLKPYKEVLELQHELATARAERKTEDTLLLVEHPRVFTIGRHPGAEKNLLLSREELEKKSIELYQVGRGGDITYHGPGQLVGYPIIDLRESCSGDVHEYLRRLEEIIIEILKEYSLKCRRNPPHTGVWVENYKIASIGVQVKRGVSLHGFALNVNVDLTPFSYINPCGIVGCSMSSVSSLLGERVEVAPVKKKVLDAFSSIFSMEPELT